jgi:small-conductance mechanosensitive channel
MPSPPLGWLHGMLGHVVVPLGIALGVACLLLLARHYALGWLQRLAGRTWSTHLEVLLGSLRTATLLWCLAIGLAAGLDAAPVPRRLAAWGTSLMVALIVLSITILAANSATMSLREIGARRGVAAAVTGLGTTLSKVLIFVLGGLVVLETSGIAITPLVAAMGVGGIAVALAMQDILSNLFAGIYLVAERPVRVGDFVKLETGQEGYITDIGWRTTRIRMPPDRTVIVPNGKLAQGVLTVRDPAEEPPPSLVALGRGQERA